MGERSIFSTTHNTCFYVLKTVIMAYADLHDQMSYVKI
jgi:hypothetical protein